MRGISCMHGFVKSIRKHQREVTLMGLPTARLPTVAASFGHPMKLLKSADLWDSLLITAKWTR